MTTPFDAAIDEITVQHYHNHRREAHSDTISIGIFNDLLHMCEALRQDYQSKDVNVWYNVRAPGGRERKIDLFVGEPTTDRKPHIDKVRIAVENKSVITAHRNKTNRYDDLKGTTETILKARSEAVVVATVLIGLAEKVLNVPDRIHPLYKKKREAEFHNDILPRLSSGDQLLWDEFEYAISENRPGDPRATAKYFRKKLPTRNPAHTHLSGYDFVMLVPVMIDNVNPPSLPRPNPLGIDVDLEYQQMLDTICKAYTSRWHWIS